MQISDIPERSSYCDKISLQRAKMILSSDNLSENTLILKKFIFLC